MSTAEHIKSLLKDFKPSNKKVNIFDPNIQDSSTRLFHLTDELGNKFRLVAFSDRIQVETQAKTSLLFAINLPDIVCFANAPLRVETQGHKIYVRRSDDG